jgi:hypothetical protein
MTASAVLRPPAATARRGHALRSLAQRRPRRAGVTSPLRPPAAPRAEVMSCARLRSAAAVTPRAATLRRCSVGAVTATATAPAPGWEGGREAGSVDSFYTAGSVESDPSFFPGTRRPARPFSPRRCAYALRGRLLPASPAADLPQATSNRLSSNSD